jgi:hypothetical protein
MDVFTIKQDDAKENKIIDWVVVREQLEESELVIWSEDKKPVKLIAAGLFFYFFLRKEKKEEREEKIKKGPSMDPAKLDYKRPKFDTKAAARAKPVKTADKLLAKSLATELQNVAGNGCVPTKRIKRYVTLYGLKEIIPRGAGKSGHDKYLVTADAFTGNYSHLNDIWNSWAFPFREDTLYGKLSVPGLLFPAISEIFNISAVVRFLDTHFVPVRPSPTQPALLTFGHVAKYTRTNISEAARPYVTDAVLAIALWYRFHDHEWGVAPDGAALRLSDVKVKLAIIDNPRVFDGVASSHPEVVVPDSWQKKLCAMAFKFFQMSRMKTAWRCQFSGMHRLMPVVFEYFQAIRVVARASDATTPSEGDVCAGDCSLLFKSLVQPVEALDVSDASHAEMRLRVHEYANDFSWMFVAAYFLACAKSPEACLVDVKRCVDAASTAPNGWREVRVPAMPPAIHHLLDQPAKPLLQPWVPALKKCTTPSTTLQNADSVLLGLLKTQPGAGRETIALRSREAFYKGLDFEPYRFAPPVESPFISAISSVELFGVFEALDAAVEGNLYDAHLPASILLNMEVNFVYAFSDCEPRRELLKTLQELLQDVPRAQCMFSGESGFLTRASTSLWWWIFHTVPPQHVVFRKSCAVACEAAAKFPNLEQLALWCAFVRALQLIKQNTTAVGVGAAAAAAAATATFSSAPEDDVACGKLVGIWADTPVFEAFKVDEVNDTQALFVDAEPYIRAEACLSDACISEAFLKFPTSVWKRAILQHVLLCADWTLPECVSVFVFALTGKDMVAVDTVSASGSSPVGVSTAVAAAPPLPSVRIMKQIIDSTANASVAHTNAVLYFAHPLHVLETVIAATTARLRWE